MAKSKHSFLVYFRFRVQKGTGKVSIVWDAPTLVQKYGQEHVGEKMYAQMGKETGVRTLQQNAALHKGFDLIARELNDAGLDMRRVLKPSVDIPWTTESVKEFLYRPVMIAMTGKESTRDLGKVDGDIDKVWDTVMRFLQEKHGVEYIPFPSEAVGDNMGTITR